MGFPRAFPRVFSISGGSTAQAKLKAALVQEEELKGRLEEMKDAAKTDERPGGRIEIRLLMEYA